VKEAAVPPSPDWVRAETAIVGRLRAPFAPALIGFEDGERPLLVLEGSVDAAFVAALAAGATELSPPNELRLADGSSFKAAFVNDPGGDVCELVDRSWIAKVQSAGFAGS
jgi:hypothetical protein